MTLAALGLAIGLVHEGLNAVRAEVPDCESSQGSQSIWVAEDSAQ
jgi:hypothetical protein